MRPLIASLCVGFCTPLGFAQAPVVSVADDFGPPTVDDDLLSGRSVPLPGATAHFYAEAEALFFWFKPVCASVPVVTVGDPRDAVPGAVGQPGTRIVVGGDPPHKFEFPLTPGGRLTFGWDRGDGAVGLTVSGFRMTQATNSQHFTSMANGYPNTYLPYQAPDNSAQALPFTVPGVVAGGSESIGSTQLWGVGTDLTVPFVIPRESYTLVATFLVGGRYLDLTDQVRVNNALRLVGDPTAFATGSDRFSTRNQFAGPEVGATHGIGCGRWSAALTTKLAAGVTRQTRNIDGVPLQPGPATSPLLVPGPLLALPSNVAHTQANRVTLVPEIAFKARFAVAPRCWLTAGYSLLYWNKVLCPGDQMSPVVNVTQLPGRGPVVGPPDPKPKFAHTDYFAQGMDFGVHGQF
jgi:hypothetical protein